MLTIFTQLTKIENSILKNLHSLSCFIYYQNFSIEDYASDLSIYKWPVY